MTVKEKIKEFLDYKGISPTSAERELNWELALSPSLKA